MILGAPDVRAIDEQLQAFGLVREGEIVGARPLEVWPEHWRALEVFEAMQSQVSVAGMGGVLGYRYEALPVVMELRGVGAEERRTVFDDFRVLEAEAVRLLNDRAKSHG